MSPIDEDIFYQLVNALQVETITQCSFERGLKQILGSYFNIQQYVVYGCSIYTINLAYNHPSKSNLMENFPNE